MTINNLSEPGKQALDYTIAGAGFAFILKLLPLITGILAVALIILRLVVGWQEYRLNRRKLGE